MSCIIDLQIINGIQQSFSDYYTVESINKTENETISGNGNYYIHDAVFSFHYQKTAIYLNSSSKVLLETCTFYNNGSTKSGGSFYIKESESVLVQICCYNSVTSEWGGAYYIETVVNSNNKNYAFECSVSQCRGNIASLYHLRGDIKVSNINSSYHEFPAYAGYLIHSPKETGIINFTTASNTSSTGFYGGIGNTGNFNIIKCNFLKE
ncbi:hypothetical protein TVAG_251920 [Trichomonas vaginalis G3]|uniref:Right handed beta helix domain-containing protein n=1 Tax=Trichomonas vaginalis (strain ATCC PRA-98 / G3) TaxID=412133 RepID=A2EF50_TRIV3|nr:hypothetical protein TVAGG3_0739540 [Trichomonas vaginalis G3]EAY08766.1 hypothetical protein TVAG_251920 [Trichomonas vaginalis G3]KAI5511781.1 hypothetical protein TVAGG3_0739540 [Trichomonas vaginalis G3]|eukprot:XP_001320989.1 hypothetical protein [Trichomonas vaginalis G3]